ncbi:hypothetical protein FR965_25860 [Serratia marcescens]|jgi:hypothetical protein|nr:hypothetical protein FR965_25860 [Serratia marcescens]
MLGTRPQKLVVSETDIDAALSHLRALPYRPQIPMSWDRQQLLDLLCEAIGNRPKINECHNIAPGVFAIIQPFGIDLLSCGEPDGRLQVWLLVRSAGTDPTRLTTLR